MTSVVFDGMEGRDKMVSFLTKDVPPRCQFISTNPGSQRIGSFHPLEEDFFIDCLPSKEDEEDEEADKPAASASASASSSGAAAT